MKVTQSNCNKKGMAKKGFPSNSIDDGDFEAMCPICIRAPSGELMEGHCLSGTQRNKELFSVYKPLWLNIHVSVQVYGYLLHTKPVSSRAWFSLPQALLLQRAFLKCRSLSLQERSIPKVPLLLFPLTLLFCLWNTMLPFNIFYIIAWFLCYCFLSPFSNSLSLQLGPKLSEFRDSPLPLARSSTKAHEHSTLLGSLPCLNLLDMNRIIISQATPCW